MPYGTSGSISSGSNIEIKPIPKAVFKSLKLFTKDILKLGKILKGSVGFMMGIADKFGALQPLMDILDGVVAIIGGSAMEAMMPTIQKLTDVLFSDEMMEVWTMLGEEIGGFIGFIMENIATLLQNPAIQKLLKTLIQIFSTVVNVIMIILKPIFDILSNMSASQLGALMWVILTSFAAIKGMAMGGPVLAAVFFGLAAAVLSPLLSMARGGVTTGMTTALLHPNEAVIPLDKADNKLGGVGGEAITINITGGVFATDERELAKNIAKTIRLYRF